MGLNIIDNSILILNSKTTCRVENDESFTVYNPDTDVLTKLSSLSKTVLDMFDGVNTVDDVHYFLSEIHNEFASEGGKKDFLNFLKKLMERGIILNEGVTSKTKTVNST